MTNQSRHAAIASFALATLLLTQPDRAIGATPSVPTPAIGAFRAMEARSEIEPLIRPFAQRDGANEFKLKQSANGDSVETHKFQHYFRGLEVVGSMALHHYGQAGVQLQNRVAEFDVDTKPTVSAEDATSLALSYVGTERTLAGLPVLKILPTQRDHSANLVYWISVEGDLLQPAEDVVIDAHSGRLIARMPHHISIAPVEVFTADRQGKSLEILGEPTGRPTGCEITDLSTGTKQEVGITQCRATLQADSCQLLLPGGMPAFVIPSLCKPVSDSDSAALQARRNAEAVLSYYSKVHGRDSFDGHGSKVTNVVHVGQHFSNAFWVEKKMFMAYGDGNPDDGLGNFTKALDVAGHEMTHGVTENTAALLQMDEAGAINEANSDFFGKMIEHTARGLPAGRAAWVMGVDLAATPGSFDGIRDLANPGSIKSKMRRDGRVVVVPYPSKASEKVEISSGAACDDTNDFCNVHLNSTIPSHASYLVHQAIGKDKAEKLYYLALTQYYTAAATFASASEDVVKACAQIFDGETCTKVRQVYSELGLI